MTATDLISDKIQEITEEMKQTGLWKKQAPSWVSDYDEKNIATESDFSEWLQFVYLPNLSQQMENKSAAMQKKYIVPQAMKFFGEDVKKGKLLQLLVELDSLS